MRLVHLVRHGTHDEVGRVLSGRSEIAINAVGRAEAARLADRFAGMPLAAVQSSPRQRARETAETIAARHGLAVEIVDALDEIDFGAWTGRSFESLDGDPDWQRWNARRGSATVPGGETMGQAVARARCHLDALEADGAVLCVSHADVIRGVVAACRGLDLDRLLTLDCAPASVTTLALADGGGRVVVPDGMAA